jgi:hypothetical protein
MKTETRERLKLGALGVIAVCLSIIVVMQYVVPALADRYYRDDYRRLSAACDLAMHDEAALRPIDGNRSHAQARLKTSADVELLVCHEYDKLRKRLLILGVSEAQLALHNLEAMETEQIPVSRLVEPHRMERF